MDWDASWLLELRRESERGRPALPDSTAPRAVAFRRERRCERPDGRLDQGWRGCVAFRGCGGVSGAVESLAICDIFVDKSPQNAVL